MRCRNSEEDEEPEVLLQEQLRVRVRTSSQ